MFNGMDLFHNDVKRGKRDVRRNLIGFEKDSIIAEHQSFISNPSKLRVYLLQTPVVITETSMM